MDRGHIIYVAAECSYRIVQNCTELFIQNRTECSYTIIYVNRYKQGQAGTTCRET